MHKSIPNVLVMTVLLGLGSGFQVRGQSMPVPLPEGMPDKSLLDGTDKQKQEFWRKLGEVAKRKARPQAGNVDRAEEVIGLISNYARHYNFYANPNALGRLQAGKRGNCGWWNKNLTEAFRAAGIPKEHIGGVQSYRRDKTTSAEEKWSDWAGEGVETTLDPNWLHIAPCVLEDGKFRVFDVWQHGANYSVLGTQSVGGVWASWGRGKLLSEWVALQKKAGRPLIAMQECSPRNSGLFEEFRGWVTRHINAGVAGGELKILTTRGKISAELNKYAYYILEKSGMSIEQVIDLLVKRGHLKRLKPPAAPKPLGLGLNRRLLHVPQGESRTLMAQLEFDDGSSRDVTGAAHWRSSVPAVASVEGGVVTARGPGITHITAKGRLKGQSLCTKPCEVVVGPAVSLKRVVVRPDRLTLAPGATAALTAMAVFSDGSTKEVHDDPMVRWSSSDGSVATARGGLLSAGQNRGQAQLTLIMHFAGRDVRSNSCEVNVTGGAGTAEGWSYQKLKLSRDQVNMAFRDTRYLTVRVLATQGPHVIPKMVTADVVWESSDPAIATVREGLIETLDAAGDCTVTATFTPPEPGASKLQAQCRVSVRDLDKPLPSVGFRVKPGEEPYRPGQLLQFQHAVEGLTDDLEFAWDFGDGATGAGGSVKHVYEDDGTFRVQLTVTSRISGKTDSVTRNVHVKSEDTPDPELKIGFDPESEAYQPGARVGFIARVVNIPAGADLRWYVDDDFVGRGARGVSHVFDQPGRYEIRLGLRHGSNFDEAKQTRVLVVGEKSIGLMGVWRNRFEAVGAPDALEIKSQYWRGGSRDWSEPVSFNGGRIGAVRKYLFYTGEQADTYNTGFLVYVPKGQKQIRFKVFHFRWPENPKLGPPPRGVLHYEGALPLHGKVPLPDSVTFTQKASRLCTVQWETEDGSICSARINKFRKGGQTYITFQGVEDLGCEEGDLDDGPERSGEDRNQFQVVDLPEHSRIQWRHRLPDTGAWSDWKGVAGYGRTKAFILYTGGVVDGGNPGYAVLIQENGHFRCVVYHWGGKGDARGLFYPVNGGWNMPTHGKTPVPASLSFTKKKTKYCEVQWRNTDGSTCRARIRLYKEQIPRAGSRYCQVDDLGCDE